MPVPTSTDEPFARHRSRTLPELPLVGRSRELSKLLNFVAAKTTALIYGPPGLGKTRLLLEIAHKLDPESVDIAYVRFQRPLHSFLLELAHAMNLDGNGTSSVVLRGMLWKAFESRPHIILLDDICEPTAPYYRFLERVLATKGNTIIGTVAHSHATGGLHRIFWNQQAMVPLQPLSRRDAGNLVQCAISAFLADRSISSDFALRVA